MLAKKNRLSAVFFRVRKRPIFSFACGGVSARVYKPEKNIFRCAVIVPVKTAKKAVSRNKIKRIIYTELQQNLSKLPVCDAVLFISNSDIQMVRRNTEEAVQRLILNT